MKNEKGIAMVLSLMIIIVLAILGTTLLSRGVSDNKRTEIFLDEVRAFWVAEAGMAKALHELNHGGGLWTGWTLQGSNASLQASLGAAGDYDIVVYDRTSSDVRVEVTGYVPMRSVNAIRRTVEVSATTSSSALFKYALSSAGKLTVRNNVNIDSYDSTLGGYGRNNSGAEGDILSADSVNLKNSIYVNGDVVIPEKAKEPNAKYYSGEIIKQSSPALVSVTVPSYLTSLPNQGSIKTSTTLSPGNYQYWMVNITGSNKLRIKGPANIYFTGKTGIKTNGNAQIYIDPTSTGPVNIYLDGNAAIKGKGINNSSKIPSNVVIYGANTATKTVTLNAKTDFYGAIYAPSSNLNILGNNDKFGSFIGSKIIARNNGDIHYDTSLGESENSGTSSYSISTWRDNQNSFNLF